MKRPELVSNRSDDEEDEDQERLSPFPVFDRLRRERLEQDAEKPVDPAAPPRELR